MLTGQHWILDICRFSTVLLLVAASCTAAKDVPKKVTIYKYLDERGVLHLSNVPPDKADKSLYARSYLIKPYTPDPPMPLLRLPIHSPEKPTVARYDDLVQAAAARHRLLPELLHAVIQVESNYNPAAVSPKGATGLMQLMPGTAKRYGVKEVTDPVQNIEGGARYLRHLLTLFEEDVKLALAAYNAGENAVIRYENRIPPYPETRNYVAKVIALYQEHVFAGLKGLK